MSVSALTSKMNVMFVIRCMGRGGAQRQLSVLARALVARGHHVAVAVFYRGGLFEPELEAVGVRIIDLCKKGRWDVFGFYTRLCRSIKRDQPDVVHAYLPTANFLCTTLRWTGVNVPVVVGVRASNMTTGKLDWLSRGSYMLERMSARRARAVIVNSEAGRRHLGLGPWHKDRIVEVVNNGIDTEYFRPDPSARELMRDKLGIGLETLIVGIVARLDPVKDHRTFLQAAALVRNRRPDVRFLCIGTTNSSYLVELQGLTLALGLQNSLAWIDDEPNMMALYNALDVLCLSSYSEGFPNVLAEAMACGVPCVATDVGDSARVLSEADEVVPSRNPGELAGAILRSLQQQDGNSGKLRVCRVKQHFSVATLVSRTERVLTAVIAKECEPPLYT